MPTPFKFRSKAVVRLLSASGGKPLRGPTGMIQRREQHSSWNEYVVLYGKKATPIRVREEYLCLVE